MVSTKKLSGEMSVRYVKSEDAYSNCAANRLASATSNVNQNNLNSAKLQVDNTLHVVDNGEGGTGGAGLYFEAPNVPGNRGNGGDGFAVGDGKRTTKFMIGEYEVEEKKPKTRMHSESADDLRDDGGWGWVVCAASFSANAVLFGILNTFGIIYVSMMDEFKKKGVEDVAFKTGR